MKLVRWVLVGACYRAAMTTILLLVPPLLVESLDLVHTGRAAALLMKCCLCLDSLGSTHLGLSLDILF
jgi:hypothetical protein